MAARLGQVRCLASWARKQMLFCPGLPGAGKTTLTAAVIQHLDSRCAHETSVGLAYIYFNFWQWEKQTVDDSFASLLKQFGQRQPSLPAIIRTLYFNYKKKGTRPSLHDITSALHLVMAAYQQVFVIVDAIDECATLAHCRTRFISGLMELQRRGRTCL